jgi:gamma-butyrobetaine dioxygenase
MEYHASLAMYVACRADRRSLAIEDETGARFEIHPRWLRERCQGEASIDQRTGQRLFNPSDLAPDLAIIEVEETAPGLLRVAFSDGHVSVFAAEAVLAEARRPADDDFTPTPEPWTATLSPLPRAHWAETADPPALRAMLAQYLRLGFLILDGVPTAPGSVLAVARRFGFVRDTNFGALFDVRSVPEASDLAYTSLSLDPHTDNPYRDPVPGIQLLHCLVNATSGGLSTLVDGLAVAETLRRTAPEAFALLASTPLRFLYRDRDTELVACAPQIECDAAGRVRAVHCSPRLDFTAFRPASELDRLYRAKTEFDLLCRAPEFEIRFKLDPGELLLFDNRRLLHGRTGFDPAEGPRHLQGCYIDGDGPRSLYRVLNRGEVSWARRSASWR